MTDPAPPIPIKIPFGHSASIRVYCLVANLARFSEVDPKTQVLWMTTLLTHLNSASSGLSSFRLFPTGEGIVVHVTEVDGSPPDIAAQVLDLARDLARLTLGTNLNLRMSVDYSSTDSTIDVAGTNLPAWDEIFQAGIGISRAMRIVHFAEPREIIVSGEYRSRLRKLGLLSEYEFYPHNPVFVKEMDEVRIFSYIPADSEVDCIFFPKEVEERHFKKFAYFPPLGSDTLNRFREIHLRQDLEHLCDYAYDSISAVNRQRTFISWGTVYDVLKTVRGDAEEEIFVVSRADVACDFWSTEESHKYLRYLKREAKRRPFVQDRLFLFDPELDKPLAPPEVIEILRDLHIGDSLHKLDISYAPSNILLNYVFGVTIFPRLRCAVAPVPVAPSYDEYYQVIGVGKPDGVFQRFFGIDFAAGAFKALVIARDDVVAELAKAYRQLRDSSDVEPL